MKTMRERWAESVPDNKEFWRLEYDDKTDTGLYEIKDKIPFDESDPSRHPAPTFHVWQKDKWLFTGQYLPAYNKYISLIHN